MSALDKLNNVGNDAFSQIPQFLGQIPNQPDLDTYKKSDPPFFKPLDVQASVLFANLATTLNIKGQSKSTDQNGKMYSPGFTPEVDFYIDPNTKDPKSNYPVERGVILNGGIIKGQATEYGVLRDTNDILNTDIPNAYKAFDDVSSEEFLHRLDQDQIPIGSALGKYNDMYLSSFVSTEQDNEDPVSFGYDLIINYANSPLFNGAIEDFITQFSSYSEVRSRMDILEKFKSQFFKFFKVDSPTSLNLNGIIPRTYYLKKLSGLDGLSEAILPEKSKQFVDYNKDLLTLTLNEDVGVNTGYLAALYKTLTWSKVHGKKMFPDNLLRFDMEIVVTEARRYNRASKNDDSTINQYADLISRYRYKVYECQFFFDKMSHGDTIDMWSLGLSDGFDIKINYKFSTVKFEKFTNFDFVNNAIIVNYGSTASIDNSKVDLTKIDPADTNKFSINNGAIQLSPIEYVLNKYSGYAPNSTTGLATDTYRALYGSNTTDDIYAKRLANMHEFNTANTLSLRQELLNKTLDNINSEFSLNWDNIKGMVIGKLVHGFTEDGYEYNIPAHYVNKALNTATSLLYNATSPIIHDLYAEKVLLQESALMNINNGINFLKNQLNGAGQKQNIYSKPRLEITTPSNSNSNQTSGLVALTHLHIYGDTKPSPLVYSGDKVGNDSPPDTPSHNKGKAFDIFNNKKEEPDTPKHHIGVAFDIYNNIKEEPDTPPHNPGAPFNIYSAILPDPADTPSHHTGVVFDIYNNKKEEPDTPTHNTGTTFDIYAYEPTQSDTPPHNTGVAFDIFTNKKEEPDTPSHNTGVAFDIFTNKKEEPDTPPHNVGSVFNIYNNTKEEPDTPPHHGGGVFDIYNNTKEESDTPPHHGGTPFSIYDTNPKDLIQHAKNNFNIYGNRPELQDTPQHNFGKPFNIYDKK